MKKFLKFLSLTMFGLLFVLALGLSEAKAANQTIDSDLTVNGNSWMNGGLNVANDLHAAGNLLIFNHNLAGIDPEINFDQGNSRIKEMGDLFVYTDDYLHLGYTDGTGAVLIQNASEISSKSRTGHSGILMAGAATVTALSADSISLVGTQITATASELNILDGATLTTAELNYVDGVSSAIQGQLDSKLNTTGGNITNDLHMGGTLSVDGTTTLSNATTVTGLFRANGDGTRSIVSDSSDLVLEAGYATPKSLILISDEDTTDAINIDSTVGSIDIDSADNITIDSADNTTITAGAADTLTLVVGATGIIDISDNAVAKTIDIGGVTASGTDTINIATEGTIADAITIGNTTAGTITILRGGTASLIDFPQFDVAATTGAVTLTRQAVGTSPFTITGLADSTSAEIDVNTSLNQGTILDIDYVAAEVQVEALTGLDINLHTNLTALATKAINGMILTLNSDATTSPQTGINILLTGTDGTESNAINLDGDLGTSSYGLNMEDLDGALGGINLAGGTMTDGILLGVQSIDGTYFDVAETTGAVTLTRQILSTSPLTITSAAVADNDTPEISINTRVDNGEVIEVDYTADTQTAAISVLDLDLANLTNDNANNLYGIHLNDFTSVGAGGNLYGIYQSGTTWDYGLYVDDDVQFNANTTIGNDALGDELSIAAMVTTSITFSAGDNRTLSIGASSPGTVGKDLTISGGTGGTGGDTNGGTLYLRGGTKGGSGSGGTVVIGDSSTSSMTIGATGKTTTMTGTFNFTGATTITQIAAGTSPFAITAIDNATSPNIDVNTHNISGTIIDVDYTTETQTGDLAGLDLNLNTNLTGEDDFDVTVMSGQTPVLTGNAAVTTNYKGQYITGGALDTTGDLATLINWYGVDVLMPNIDSSANGVVTSYGLKITGGTITAGAGSEDFAHMFLTPIAAAGDISTEGGLYADDDGIAYYRSNAVWAAMNAAADFSELLYPVDFQFEDGEKSESMGTYYYNGNIAAGDLIGINPETGNYRKAQAGDVLSGVESGNRGNYLLEEGSKERNKGLRQVGLVGHVLANVTGDISYGDPIALSDKAGVGKKTKASEAIVGYAREAHTGDNVSQIEILVMPQRELVVQEAQSNIDVLTVVKTATFEGTILVKDGATFEKEVVFKDKVKVSSDTAGNATINAGKNSIQVEFSAPYDKAPEVTITSKKNPGSYYWISDVTETGFKINLENNPSENIPFSWMALEVNE